MTKRRWAWNWKWSRCHAASPAWCSSRRGSIVSAQWSLLLFYARRPGGKEPKLDERGIVLRTRKVAWFARLSQTRGVIAPPSREISIRGTIFRVPVSYFGYGMILRLENFGLGRSSSTYDAYGGSLVCLVGEWVELLHGVRRGSWLSFTAHAC